MSKIYMLVRNLNFGQNSKFSSKIEIFLIEVTLVVVILFFYCKSEEIFEIYNLTNFQKLHDLSRKIEGKYSWNDEFGRMLIISFILPDVLFLSNRTWTKNMYFIKKEMLSKNTKNILSTTKSCYFHKSMCWKIPFFW